jgi:hypothetical protein
MEPVKLDGGTGYGAGRSKVDELLTPEDRGEYGKLVAAGATGRECRAWLRARGYAVGAAAVWSHLRRTRAALAELRATAVLYDEARALARRHGPGWLSDLVVLQLERAALRRLGDDKRLAGATPAELAALARVVALVVQSRRIVDDGRPAAAPGSNAGASPASTARQVAARVAGLLGLSGGDGGPIETSDGLPRDGQEEQS